MSRMPSRTSLMNKDAGINRKRKIVQPPAEQTAEIIQIEKVNNQCVNKSRN